MRKIIIILILLCASPVLGAIYYIADSVSGNEDNLSTNDPTVNDNLLNGNSGGNSSGFTLDITGDDANLTSAPAYVSASDRHLTSSSPGKQRSGRI
jgi:hypothetical protein